MLDVIVVVVVSTRVSSLTGIFCVVVDLYALNPNINWLKSIITPNSFSSVFVMHFIVSYRRCHPFPFFLFHALLCCVLCSLVVFCWQYHSSKYCVDILMAKKCREKIMMCMQLHVIHLQLSILFGSSGM